MHITRVFRCGNSQAVRLPREFQFEQEELLIFRDGDDIVLRRCPANLASVVELLRMLPEDAVPDR